MWRALLAVSILLWCAVEGQRITCRDGNGNPVDWYILYNTPKLNNKGLSGLEYYYMDSTTSEWHENINDPGGALARTLKPILTPKQDPDLGFITYSDQPPDGQVGPRFGHSKGVVMMDRNTGIWLLHSTPNFPCNRKEGKLWPASGVKYAQTFICVTFPYSQFKQIGQHLLYIRAYPFDDPYIPNNFYQELHAVINKADIKPNNPFLDQKLTSAAGQQFRGFAKYSTDEKNATVQDIYGLIAGKLSCDLAVKIWGAWEGEESDGLEDGERVDSMINGERAPCLEDGSVKVMEESCRVDRPEEGSANCAGEGSRVYSLEEERADCAEEERRVDRPKEGSTDSLEALGQLQSVEDIRMKRGSDWVEWSKGNDHSKWCVSEDKNKPWTCISDMNKRLSQMERPGGALCINLEDTWEKFTDFIAKKVPKL